MEKWQCAVEGVGIVNVDTEFYKGKRVLVTGHTGFKGIWLCKMLLLFGAEITGFSLPSPTAEGGKLFHISGVEEGINSVVGDVRDYVALRKVFDEAQPEIVFHLAAQPIVLESYRDPVGTYATNVMGTVHVLESVRQTESVKSFLNVTTDKVYENKEWVWGYRETEPLNGFDPYSNSKSCSEIATHCYRNSFFADGRCAVSTARAGNVVGGGDFSPYRIVPDCVRAAVKGEKILVRHPAAIRPYQHVLDALYAYLLIGQEQYEDKSYVGAYNIGPEECDCVSTGELASLFCEQWGEGQQWETVGVEQPHEDQILKLDCSKMKNVFHWRPRWHIREAIGKTVEWTKIYRIGKDIAACMERQIMAFMDGESADVD